MTGSRPAVRRAAGCASLALALAQTSPASAFAIHKPRLPRCVTTDVVLVSALDSRRTSGGSPFVFKTVNNVPPQGDIPRVRRGTYGYGVVIFAQHAGGNGRAGRFVLEPRFLQLAGGRHLPAIPDPALGDGFVGGASRDAPGVLSFIPVVGWALVGGYNAFHRGTEVVVPRGTPIRVVLGDDLAEGRCSDPPE